MMNKTALIAASFLLAANVSAEIGTVAWFNQQDGYGYINRQETNESIFVHFTAIAPLPSGQRVLTSGQVVDFQWQEVDGVKRATWVILVE